MATQRADLTLELLSPCFLGGAHQQPEFRIASLRGVWRYWYRALYGQGTEDKPWEEELRLFGSTDGRGVARVVPLEPPSKLTVSTGPWAKAQGQQPSGIDYLLFTMGMNQRRYLDQGQSIRLRLAVDESCTDRAVRSLVAACAFSGLGARSRRMAGALALRSASGPSSTLVAVEPTVDPGALARRLTELLAPALRRRLTRPQYHVVGQETFAAGVLQKTFGDWRQALEDVGGELRSFRLRRQPDYDVAKRALQTRSAPGPGQTIKRAAFGLPMQFRFKGPPGVLHVLPPEGNRRGSPLFLTLERLAPNRLAVVWCLFRSPLTSNGRMRIGSALAPAPDFSVIDEMLTQPFWASHRIA